METCLLWPASGLARRHVLVWLVKHTHGDSPEAGNQP